MKKLYYVLIPLVLLLAGCGREQTPSQNGSGSNENPQEVPVKLQILLSDTAFRGLTAGKRKEVPYEVVAPQGVTCTLSSFGPQDWVVDFSKDSNDSNKGVLSLTLPSSAQNGKVLLIAVGSDGSFYSQALVVTVKGDNTPADAARLQVTVDAGAGSLALPAVVTDIELAADWMTLNGAKLQLAANEQYDSRQGTVTFKIGEESYSLTVVQAQKDAIVLTDNTIAVGADGETVPFVVKANVAVEAVSDVDWITVTPATKGLEDKPYTVTVAANESMEAREGKITFSSEDLQQVVKVTQEAAKPVVPPTPADGEFVLVTDASELLAGDELIIVNQGRNYALGAQSGNYRSRVSVTVENDSISEPDDDVVIVTLEGQEGAWNLKVADGYLAAQSKNNNYLRTVNAVTDYATWTISVTNAGLATVKAAAGARNQLLYNSQRGNERFSCYANTSVNTKEVLLFRKASAPAEPVTQYNELGLYLGKQQRLYTAGTDQYVRSYDGNALQFVLLAPAAKEQVQLSGFTTGLKAGDAVTVSVSWKKGSSSVLQKEYAMQVLKEEGGKLWVGDAQGRGFIIRK